jgi:hypothetical protein
MISVTLGMSPLAQAQSETLESTISPPTGLLGVGLGGDSSRA